MEGEVKKGHSTILMVNKMEEKNDKCAPQHNKVGYKTKKQRYVKYNLTFSNNGGGDRIAKVMRWIVK